MIAQIAPAVRVAIAEAIGLKPGDVSVGQLVAGLRQLGFDYVFGESLQASAQWFGTGLSTVLLNTCCTVVNYKYAWGLWDFAIMAGYAMIWSAPRRIVGCMHAVAVCE